MSIETVLLGSQGLRVPAQGQIPGTRRPARLEENAGALDLTLTDDDRARLEPLGQLVVGARY